MQPLVSVVIPYFNDGPYIDEAVESILNQTYRNVEIIIVDDASTDAASIAKIAHYQKPNTRVIHHPANKYPSAARNTGFAAARGQYVLTLDADDMFERTFIEKAVKILDQQPQVGAVSAWAKGFGQAEFLWQLKGGGIEDFVPGNQCVACALIRKEAWATLKGYNENLRHTYEDWDFWLRLTHLGYTVHVIAEPLFLYRQKDSSRRLTAHTSHADSLRQVIAFNKAIFEQYLPHLFAVKDSTIATLRQETVNLRRQIAQMEQSRQYVWGARLLAPFRKIKSFAKTFYK